MQDSLCLPRWSKPPDFTEEIQGYYCLHMLLAPMKENKVAHQAWIKVFTARDYPNVFPQSILIRALSLH